MAPNRVQFQAGLSLPAFMAKFGTDRKCAQALLRARWPDGFRCPACDGAAHSTFDRECQTYFQWTACRHQTTLIAGTLFEATKLRLSSWFLALHLLTSSKTNLSALELKRQLRRRNGTPNKCVTSSTVCAKAPSRKVLRWSTQAQ